MAYKLKNLEITSTDLVDVGANPDAYISLFKRKAKAFVEGLVGATSSCEGHSSHPSHSGEDFSATHSTATPPKIREAGATFPVADSVWKNHANKVEIKEDTNMELTQQEQDIVEAYFRIARKYGLEPKPEKLQDYEEKIAKLEYEIAMSRFRSVAKKYEKITSDTEALAKNLYTMEEKGGYPEYISLLDQNLSLVEKSGLFSELGRNSFEPTLSHSHSNHWVSSGASSDYEEAFMTAYQTNPAFAKAYDTAYGQR